MNPPVLAEVKKPTVDERLDLLESAVADAQHNALGAVRQADAARATIRRYELYGAIGLAMLYGALLYRVYLRRGGAL